MDKLKMHTTSIVDENIARIAALFPHCVTETNKDGRIVRAIDFDMLRQELSDVVVEGPIERFQFSWPEKRSSMLLANAPISKTLRPCRAESVDFDSTQNIYIEGDNLDALKLLRETYLGKVKVIYIDPPYNTGNDFVYEDDFAESAETYMARSGAYDAEGNRLVKNLDSNGRFHTDWLNMIYARLRLAKDLLSDDGVIFISIDDNEACNLQKICNEIFGEDNFIGQLVWQSTQKNDPRFMAINHEYVLCYVKNIFVQNEGGKWRTKHPLVDEMMAEYEKIRRKFTKIEDIQKAWSAVVAKEKYAPLKHYKFVDMRGPYFAADISDPQRTGPKHDFVIHPVTGQLCKPPAGGYSPREAEMRRRLENDEIHFGPTHESVVCSKKYLTTAEDRLNSVYYEDGRRATKLLESIIGKDIFDHPKSEIMIKRLLGFTTNDGDIVLDFFSGSATTAHSVMELNATENKKLRYILVQIPEVTAEKSGARKAGYETICEIAKERIRRTAAIIRESGAAFAGEADMGFRVLKIDTSNMEDVYYTPDEYSIQTLFGMADNIKPDRTPEDLLFQVMLDLGILLDSKIEETVIGGKKVFSVADGYLIACFDSNVTDETVKAIAQKQPYYAVFRDSGFGSDSVATNFDQIFETYSPSTTRKVL